MSFSGVNYLAVLVAAVAGFAFGAAWYMALSRVWLGAVGLTREQLNRRSPVPFILSFVALLVMGWVLAGMLGHFGAGQVTVRNGIVSGLLLGGLYAAAASGLSVSFGMLDIVNIAHPALMVAGAFTVLYLNASVTAGPYPADFSCFTSSGSPLSCSPSWCNSSSAVLSGASIQSCVPNATSQDYAILVPTVGCKTCTTSADARCTTAFLTATFGRFSSIYAAYCDSSRLVLLTDTRGAGSYNLDNVPFPPGGFNAAWPYAACRTRMASLTPAWSVLTFPLSPSLYSSAATTNNLGVYPGPQNGENGPLYNSITLTQYNIPASGKVGSTITGQDVFPVFNNRATFTSENCEVDACNEHIGQGFGQPHLHGDPFGPTCLYSAANYTVNGVSNWTAHPPLIGIADDGLWIYGRYLSSAAPGGNIALDICGGHSHGGSTYGQGTSGGYHYHTQLIAATSSGLGSGTNLVGLPYPQTTTGPYQCFMGNLSAE